MQYRRRVYTWCKVTGGSTWEFRSFHLVTLGIRLVSWAAASQRWIFWKAWRWDNICKNWIIARYSSQCIKAIRHIPVVRLIEKWRTICSLAFVAFLRHIFNMIVLIGWHLYARLVVPDITFITLHSKVWPVHKKVTEGTGIYASPFSLCWPPTVHSMMRSSIGFNVPYQNEHHCISKWGLVGRVSWMSCEQGVRVPQRSKLGQVSSICTQDMRWGVWHSISDSSPMVYKGGG